jgi:hypothetical protein
MNNEVLTVGATAVPLNRYDDTTRKAMITVETDQIRYWVDGNDPSASAGHLLEAGDAVVLETRNEIKHFKAIRVTLDATCQVSYV